MFLSSTKNLRLQCFVHLVLTYEPINVLSFQHFRHTLGLEKMIQSWSSDGVEDSCVGLTTLGHPYWLSWVTKSVDTILQTLHN